MNEQKNNGRGIFYGVIGVATLVVAIIGATFAYFTATATNGANVITGNMATITFDLAVKKVTTADETKGGMIPMSNSMIEQALTKNASVQDKGICVDDNGNAVCQIYKVTVENTGSASLFVDGYVTLTGGSGSPTDDATATTTMRWAQAFCTASGSGATETVTNCSTVGTTTTGATGIAQFATLDTGTTGTVDPKNAANIKSTKADVVGSGTISGNTYDIINRNYIRISKHTDGSGYTKDGDVTSALVYNQNLAPAASVNLYFVVWLSETGTDQTAGNTEADQNNFASANGLQFFHGSVTFNSAEGSEVTATFTDYAAVAKPPQP